jgi:hypothetical protein
MSNVTATQGAAPMNVVAIREGPSEATLAARAAALAPKNVEAAAAARMAADDGPPVAYGVDSSTVAYEARRAEAERQQERRETRREARLYDAEEQGFHKGSQVDVQA